MHESLKTSRVTLTSRYFSFHHILICFIYMLVSYSDDNKEQFMISNEKIGSVITPCNLLKFNINMKYLHISCLYYLCNFWSFSSIGFIWYFIPRIKSNASVVIRGCVLRTLSKNNSTLCFITIKTKHRDIIFHRILSKFKRREFLWKIQLFRNCKQYINKYFSSVIKYIFYDVSECMTLINSSFIIHTVFHHHHFRRSCITLDHYLHTYRSHSNWKIKEKEWNERKRKKGSVLVGHHGNLYKKLNVHELFATATLSRHLYVWSQKQTISWLGIILKTITIWHQRNVRHHVMFVCYTKPFIYLD